MIRPTSSPSPEIWSCCRRACLGFQEFSSLMKPIPFGWPWNKPLLKALFNRYLAHQLSSAMFVGLTVLNLPNAACSNPCKNLKGGWDGWFDRYVNRKLSGVLTRLFLKIGVSPNTITLISMLIGLAAAGCIATGLYEWGVMGLYCSSCR